MSKPRTLMTIEVGVAGVNRIIARPRTVAEQHTCNRLAEVTALPIRLLHDSIRESDELLTEESPEQCAVSGGYDAR